MDKCRMQTYMKTVKEANALFVESYNDDGDI